MKARLLFFALLSLLLGATTCHAQGIATVALSGFVVSKLLDQFEGTANRLLQNGSTAGDALSTKFGNELRVATKNAELALATERDKTFEQLNQSEQSLLISMNAIITAANSAVNTAQTMEEIGNLDLVEFTNRLPFTQKVDFYLSSMKGLTQIHSAANYDLDIIGLGVGLAPGDRSYKVSVKIADITLDGVNLRPQNAKELLVDVPNQTLERYFQDDKVSFVPVELTSTITVHKTTLGIFHSDSGDSGRW